LTATDCQEVNMPDTPLPHQPAHVGHDELLYPAYLRYTQGELEESLRECKGDPGLERAVRDRLAPLSEEDFWRDLESMAPRDRNEYKRRLLESRETTLAEDAREVQAETAGYLRDLIAGSEGVAPGRPRPRSGDQPPRR
jgi:hypothetical protein